MDNIVYVKAPTIGISLPDHQLLIGTTTLGAHEARFHGTPWSVSKR